jgi:hypothetical protein
MQEQIQVVGVVVPVNQIQAIVLLQAPVVQELLS